MNAGKLDISSLNKAIISLEEAVREYQKAKENKFIRDASIQRFEYTYELCAKMLKRYLETTEPNAQEVDQMSFPNLIRTGSERALLQNGWDSWKIYREARNIIAHTYDEKKADYIITILPNFLTDAKYLYTQLERLI